MMCAGISVVVNYAVDGKIYIVEEDDVIYFGLMQLLLTPLIKSLDYTYP